MNNITVRNYKQTDHNYLLNSWLKCNRYEGDNKQLNSETYYKTYEPLYKKLIKQSKILIACMAEDVDVILGYVVYLQLEDTTVLFHLQVKKEIQLKGIAKLLLSSAGSPLKFITERLPIKYKNVA